MLIVILLSVVKIYISNQIYYKSREINKLEIEVAALKEESSILSMNIEKLRYKTEILDSLEADEAKNRDDINISLTSQESNPSPQNEANGTTTIKQSEEEVN
jgi:cell division protein FtsL